MATGGFFNMKEVPRFNGGLFAEVNPLPLEAGDLAELAKAAELDWSGVEPAIFGTLFERSLDPSKRAQLGAHYTGRADIERVVEPVVMAPLRRRWDVVRAEADKKKAEWDAATTPQTRQNRGREFAAILARFQEELRGVTILDPACGSGNFLYVALAKLLDLEKEALVYGAANGLPIGTPLVQPGQLLGLEINEYARELAQVVVWIGYLKWKLDNGFPGHGDPILEPLETIRLQDALLDLSDPAHPKEAAWPAADFIIGNPPFLGRQLQNRQLGEEYTGQLRSAFGARLSRGCDLCCYFFEQARKQIVDGKAARVGLLGNTTIRQVDNREVLDRIVQTGSLFLAWSNIPWTIEGASVRISIVGFDNGAEQSKWLDGAEADMIAADLTTSADVALAKQLAENKGISFQGPIKVGPFDVAGELARAWLALPTNVSGRPNSDVVRPYFNASDVVRRWSDTWVIDFGVDRTAEEAAQYEAPFEYIKTHVLPVRTQNKQSKRRQFWWIHGSPAPEMRQALNGLERFFGDSCCCKAQNFRLAAESVVS